MSLIKDSRLRRSIRQFLVFDPQKRANFHEHLIKYYKDELVDKDVYKYVDPKDDQRIKSVYVPKWLRGFKNARGQLYLAVRRTRALFDKIYTVDQYAVFRASLVQLI